MVLPVFALDCGTVVTGFEEIDDDGTGRADDCDGALTVVVGFRTDEVDEDALADGAGPVLVVAVTLAGLAEMGGAADLAIPFVFALVDVTDGRVELAEVFRAVGAGLTVDDGSRLEAPADGFLTLAVTLALEPALASSLLSLDPAPPASCLASADWAVPLIVSPFVGPTPFPSPFESGSPSTFTSPSPSLPSPSPPARISDSLSTSVFFVSSLCSLTRTFASKSSNISTTSPSPLSTFSNASPPSTLGDGLAEKVSDDRRPRLLMDDRREPDSRRAACCCSMSAAVCHRATREDTWALVSSTLSLRRKCRTS